MSREVDLESVRALQEYAGSIADVFEIIKTNLERPGETPEKAAALEDALREHGRKHESERDAYGFCMDLWFLLLDVASHIPCDHPWQDALVQAVNGLQQRGGQIGSIGNGKRGKGLVWEHLPGLPMIWLDFWVEPTTVAEAHPEIASDPIELGEMYADWKNLNSFTARITTDTYSPWLNFPFWVVESALEHKLDKGDELDYKLWVATEWILRCGEIFFKYLAEGNRSRGPAGPRGRELLLLWENRLLEIASEKEALELSDDLVERASKAAEIIAQFEARLSSPIAAGDENKE